MKAIFRIAILAMLPIMLSAQENFNLEMVSNVEFDENTNDIWGYVDAEGTEYAVVGTFTATRIYSLEDPANPIERAVITGVNSIWRDIKSYKDHLYVVTDDFNSGLGQIGEGMTIIDMSMAPESISFSRWQPDIDIDGVTGRLGECHNIYIDTLRGNCYLAGCQGIGREGVLIVSLEDLDNPVVVGIEDDRYSHDAFVLDDLLYSSDITAGFLSIYDVSDVTNPVEVGRASTTSFFTHNAWTSADGQYVFTTDEKPNAKVDAYDISDLDNIKRVDDFIPADRYSDRAIPHNVHYNNGYLYMAWYTEGMVVIDANRPQNMVKIASYDTYRKEDDIPEGQSWYYGLWGAYPYLPSGLLLGSDINSGLYIWKPVHESGGVEVDGYARACYLEGTVTDANSGNPVVGAQIRILSDVENVDRSKVMGLYKTGQLEEGTFMVEFTHPNYDPLELEATLSSGEVTLLDAVLNGTSLEIRTVDATGERIPFVRVRMLNTETGVKTILLSNNNGIARSSLKSGQTYSFLASRWDYKGTKVEGEFVAEGAISFEVVLEEGYQDDFFADLGWTVESTAQSGGWQRGIPTDQEFDGSPSQISMDLDFDLGDECFATGLNGDSAGANDIDNGITVLSSRKMDWSDYEAAKISYHLFFVNEGGAGNPPPTPDDSVNVSITNGSETISLPGLTESTFMWTDSIISVLTPSDIAFTDNMVISFTAMDVGPGHIAEAQLDGFNVDQMRTTSTSDLGVEKFKIYPNPVNNYLQISRSGESTGAVHYKVYSTTGKLVDEGTTSKQLIFINTNDWIGSGMYYLHLSDVNNNNQIQKVVKM